ncbi:FG-GAP repeat domain-containing protein [Myxococcus landrumensis]|uniref:VCBS repeat-containing protein n=1 Tax=Myxococcus landrumensis TaxID=2813577 RepID=A0ABX7NES9_9BACT|nr:VCBS repeat-containing protein [Myxococcus landrumus]QSQ17325.1 VCBS repeat-containing protein [Myxococcus landrumus]
MRGPKLFLLVTPLLVALGAKDANGHFEMAPAPAATGFWLWDMNMEWCNYFGAQLFINDFNGDGMADMLCHDWLTGDKRIAFARPPDGHFVGNDWQAAMGWCNRQGSQLFTGDFDGDGRADMICHDSITGEKWIAFARPGGYFVGTDWYQDMKWCNRLSARFSVADFNGDGRTDLFCYDVSSGSKMFAYSAF